MFEYAGLGMAILAAFEGAVLLAMAVVWVAMIITAEGG